MKTSLQPQVQIGNGPLLTPLQVCNLDVNVTESQLWDLFGQAGEVLSLRVCRDLNSWKSLGYAFVNFGNPKHAERALDQFNGTQLNGQSIRIMYSDRDASVQGSSAGNIYIENLGKKIDHDWLHEKFAPFGKILSCKVAVDVSGQMKGYGFVQYDNEESAKKAIEKLNGMLLNKTKVHILSEPEREMSVDKTKFTNLFVKNLSELMTDEDLKKVFGGYGLITSSVVMRCEDGKSKGFGFVNFENAEDASRAVESLNGKNCDNMVWYVGRAKNKSEREREMKYRKDQKEKDTVDKSQGSKLYVNDLDVSFGDDKLHNSFSSFGSITSCKVVQDCIGVSIGSGYVASSSPEEASRAVSEMNDNMIGNKPLYVAIAPKGDGGEQLQDRAAQTRSIATACVPPRMPMYTPGGPGVGQWIFYGQPPPPVASIASPGFGFPQQLIPHPNRISPMHQQGFQYPQHGGHPIFPAQQVLQSVPVMHHQMIPIYPRYHYPPVSGGLHPAPHGTSPPVSIAEVKHALVNASPMEQRTILGDNLHPLVEQFLNDRSKTGKVTGMLLEMDQTEVLHLLESREALIIKIGEALHVLRNVSRESS